MGPKTPPAQAAAAWVRLWLGCSEVEREAMLMMLTARTRLQVCLAGGLGTHAQRCTLCQALQRGYDALACAQAANVFTAMRCSANGECVQL